MLIYFPNKLGQLKNGVQKTPSYLKKILKNDFYEVKCNNCVNQITQNKSIHLSKNLINLYNANNMFPGRKINIGGDHSMSIATVAESLNRYPQNELKVLWFDAHPDINTYKSSKSKNFHGMSLSYLSGISRSEYFPFIKKKLNLENLLYIGIRDIDEYERNFIKKKKINYITCSEINTNPEKSLQNILNFIEDDPLHISFDVDCMDPNLLPCTGTQSENGLNLNVKHILDSLIDNNIVNMDITEINFDLGDQNDRDKTLKNTLYLFDKYLNYKL